MLNIYEIIEKIRKGEKLTNDERLLYKMIINCEYGFSNWKPQYKNKLRKLRDKKC